NNPYAPDVPCHRVVKGDLSLGGFGGEIEGDKISRKIALLRSEGVQIENGRVSASCLHTFN
ncbi:MAG: MGMT family protein, partial [Kangiellaceae bacterium]|nr:MGMT family protein [Kangiellaceae bacterium]